MTSRKSAPLTFSLAFPNQEMELLEDKGKKQHDLEPDHKQPLLLLIIADYFKFPELQF